MNRKLKSRFTSIFRSNGFQGKESISGPGSELEQTKEVVDYLPKLFDELKINSFLDAPCGDFHWMRKVDLTEMKYLGLEIVEEITDQNIKKYQTESIQFKTLNIISDSLPSADLMLCRDCLVHLTFSDIHRFFENFKKSKITYLLTTTFPGRANDKNISENVGWRPLDLTADPIGLPGPLKLFNEGCTENEGIFSDKSLGLWKREQI